MNINITDPIFHDEAKALAHLESDRWPDGEPVCPFCESAGVTRMGGKTQAGMFLCNVCRQKFTVRTGTVMERSHIPLHKWLLATHIMAASKKGMSAKQMERMLGVTYKTAWFLCHRIREAMDEANNPHDPLGGEGKIVESDEAIVGGRKKKRLSGKIAAKKKIVTLIERGGRARSFHITHIDHTNIRGAIVTNVHRSSHLMTDDARFYNRIGEEFASHHTTLHSNREFPQQHRREFLFHLQARRGGHLSPHERNPHAPLSGGIRHALFDEGRIRRRACEPHSQRHGRSPPYLSAD
jgi:transposase-like protein